MEHEQIASLRSSYPRMTRGARELWTNTIMGGVAVCAILLPFHDFVWFSLCYASVTLAGVLLLHGSVQYRRSDFARWGDAPPWYVVSLCMLIGLFVVGSAGSILAGLLDLPIGATLLPALLTGAWLGYAWGSGCIKAYQVWLLRRPETAVEEHCWEGDRLVPCEQPGDSHSSDEATLPRCPVCGELVLLDRRELLTEERAPGRWSLDIHLTRRD